MRENCLIIAGEKSGEEHALTFIKELKRKCPDVDFWGVGGDELATQMDIEYHLKDFSSWGISEVIKKIPFYLKALKYIERKAIERKTKTAILIDFQDFNLRLARRLKKQGVRVLYYVAPQAWAWKAKRAGVLQKTVHTLFTIIPFEKKWFNDRGVSKVVAINHPLLTKFEKDLPHIKNKNFSELKKEVNLLLLPGSRNFEVAELLPEFIGSLKELKKDFPLKVSLVLSSNINKDLIKPYASFIDKIYSNEELTKALTEADFAFGASGTVTLACALFEVPTVVAYKGSLLNEFIFYQFIDYKGPISLANIVHQKQVYPELMQDRATSYNMGLNLRRWLTDDLEYEKIKETLAKTKSLLQGESIDVASYMAGVLTEDEK
ncbi:MAG: lipid-A-disaccharide synthase [Epsilonproteobacteria bacterium]|nr:MAG: lipid-A-disaccharide synthase [Campylobacterota bacterium]RLA66712.1 MAG: lipid-A-disaccharide synthase [Campylobacterota bacterium]